MQRIEDDRQRLITYSKRKRGLLKKAIELSSYCDQEIFIMIYDRAEKRLVEYNSAAKFNATTVQNLEIKIMEKYQNLDYNLISKLVTPLQFERAQTQYQMKQAAKKNEQRETTGLIQKNQLSSVYDRQIESLMKKTFQGLCAQNFAHLDSNPLPPFRSKRAMKQKQSSENVTRMCSFDLISCESVLTYQEPVKKYSLDQLLPPQNSIKSDKNNASIQNCVIVQDDAQGDRPEASVMKKYQKLLDNPFNT